MKPMHRRAFITAAAASGVVAASTMQDACAQQQAPTSGAFADAISYSAARGGATFLAARNGIVLSEAYASGAADTRWPVGQGTRAMMPLLIGALVGDGVLRLDDPASLTLGVWGADATRAAITIRALLNGTSGLAFGPNDAHDLAAALALQPPADAASASFNADAAPYLLLGEIARRKLAEAGGENDPAQYLTDRVLGPLGCAPVAWTRLGDGAPRWDDGAAISARSWAQIGELVRREGVWRAQQLVDSETMQEAVRGSFAEPRAGFGFWLAVSTRGGAAAPIETDLWRASSPAPTDLAMAAGANGQRLYLSPSAGVVIVRQANTASAAPWSDAAFLTLVWRGL
jgi:CubicO group peptidase (beta-lactamase class C family)